MLTRLAAVLVLSGFALQSMAARAAETFEGFLTNIVSPAEFDVGQRHVFSDSHTKWQRAGSLPDYLATIRVGLPVRVTGESRNGKFVAKSIYARKYKLEEKFKGRGLIQQPPRLDPAAQVWLGTIWVEGYPLRVASGTKLVDPGGNDLPASEITTNMWASYEAFRSGDGAIVATRTILPALIVPQACLQSSLSATE